LGNGYRRRHEKPGFLGSCSSIKCHETFCAYIAYPLKEEKIMAPLLEMKNIVIDGLDR
jgi:hypothetical protein